MLRKILLSSIYLLVSLTGGVSDEDRCIWKVLDFAGNKRGELEQVLSHYEN